MAFQTGEIVLPCCFYLFPGAPLLSQGGHQKHSLANLEATVHATARIHGHPGLRPARSTERRVLGTHRSRDRTVLCEHGGVGHRSRVPMQPPERAGANLAHIPHAHKLVARSHQHQGRRALAADGRHRPRAGAHPELGRPRLPDIPQAHLPVTPAAHQNGGRRCHDARRLRSIAASAVESGVFKSYGIGASQRAAKPATIRALCHGDDE
mmetsp:Transcript_22778/g.57416  ORF Transcript_22778/g.57416 Transcript_22778/m.57416 type:complete len:209 (-) Transcript_22778:29-655(-)